LLFRHAAQPTVSTETDPQNNK